MTPRHPLRFFLVLSVVPAALLAAFACLAVVGALGLAVGVVNGAGLLPPLMLLQLFAASSGFRVAAGRGHYDLLLTSGASRAAIAASHCLVSVGPGLAAWALLAAAEIASAGRPGTLATRAALTQMLVISSLAWAMNVPFPRFTAAVMLLVTWAAIPALPVPLTPIVSATPPWISATAAVPIVTFALWRTMGSDVALGEGR